MRRVGASTSGRVYGRSPRGVKRRRPSGRAGVLPVRSARPPASRGPVAVRTGTLQSIRRGPIFGACLLLLSASWTAGASEISATSVVTNGETHRLVRNGQPYFVQGVGGHTHLAELAAIGGNSIRTWGTDGLDEILLRKRLD